MVCLFTVSFCTCAVSNRRYSPAPSGASRHRLRRPPSLPLLLHPRALSLRPLHPSSLCLLRLRCKRNVAVTRKTMAAARTRPLGLPSSPLPPCLLRLVRAHLQRPRPLSPLLGCLLAFSRSNMFMLYSVYKRRETNA